MLIYLYISNHRLEVEVGRYARTAKQLRLCKTCVKKSQANNLNSVGFGKIAGLPATTDYIQPPLFV